MSSIIEFETQSAIFYQYEVDIKRGFGRKPLSIRYESIDKIIEYQYVQAYGHNVLSDTVLYHPFQISLLIGGKELIICNGKKEKDYLTIRNELITYLRIRFKDQWKEKYTIRKFESVRSEK